MKFSHLNEILNEKIISDIPIGGGCIGDSRIIKCESGKRYFVKSYGAASEMVQHEAAGLRELAKPDVIRIPEVFYSGDDILVLEYINSGKPKNQFREIFGRQFARLHQFVGEKFGFYSNNYIGSTPQINEFYDNWIDFYFEKRLGYQISLAIRNGYADKSFQSKIDKIRAKSETLYDSRNIKPSLLHGDLWSGNYMVDEEGNPVLIDPAVYFGDREADLAMTKLFGSFGSEFYEAYNEEYPLLPGYTERENLYKLYHILNHLNLFGSGYYSQAQTMINYYL